MLNMKQFFVAVLMAAAVLTGCQSGSEESSQAQQEQQEQVPVKVTISQGEGEEMVAEKELEVEEGTSLMEVLKYNFEEVEEKDGFVTKIEGIEANEGEQKAWFFTINGEDASVGAKEYKVKENDSFTFDFHAWD